MNIFSAHCFVVKAHVKQAHQPFDALLICSAKPEFYHFVHYEVFKHDQDRQSRLDLSSNFEMESHNLDSDLHVALIQVTSRSSFQQKTGASFQMCYQY